MLADCRGRNADSCEGRFEIIDIRLVLLRGKKHRSCTADQNRLARASVKCYTKQHESSGAGRTARGQTAESFQAVPPLPCAARSSPVDMKPHQIARYDALFIAAQVSLSRPAEPHCPVGPRPKIAVHPHMDASWLWHACHHRAVASGQFFRHRLHDISKTLALSSRASERSSTLGVVRAGPGAATNVNPGEMVGRQPCHLPWTLRP